MNKKIGVTLLATLILASAHLSDAQQAKKVPRVGFLAVSQQPYHEGFRQGLRELGYVEGKNVVVRIALRRLSPLWGEER
jgi:putative ABC transport system substrate-binding protein